MVNFHFADYPKLKFPSIEKKSAQIHPKTSKYFVQQDFTNLEH